MVDVYPDSELLELLELSTGERLLDCGVGVTMMVLVMTEVVSVVVV